MHFEINAENEIGEDGLLVHLTTDINNMWLFSRLLCIYEFQVGEV